MARIVRFAHEDGPTYGVVDGDQVAVIEPHPFTAHSPTGKRVPLEGLRLLAPVLPSKVVCVGRNYHAHIEEFGNPVPEEALYFLKPSTAVIGPGDPILYPSELTENLHHEAELAVVIGALLSRVDPAEAMAGVLGYTVGNDVTLRDRQRAENQWYRGKAYDSSCPLGPAIVTDVDPSDLRIRCWVDDELRQDSTTAALIWDVPTLISEVSQFTTLLPGDVILTGTPSGVGPMLPGQRVRIEIEGVGVLENPIVERPARGERGANGQAG